MTTPVLRNALWSGTGRLVTLAVGLCLTPYLLLRLGPERFGAWALLSGIAGLAGLLDLSFKSSFVRHLAEADARGDDEGVRAILATALASYAAFALLLTPAAVLASPAVVAALGLPDTLRGEAAGALALLVVGVLVASLLSIFPAACDARQRMDLTNLLGCGALGLGAASSIAVVEAGGGLRGLAAVQLGSLLAFHLACIPAARHLLGPFRLRRAHLRGDVFRRLFRFGVQLHVSAAAWAVTRQLDKLLLTRWAGLPFVASYELGARIVGNAGTLQPFLAAGLLPAASQLEARGERTRLVALYRESSRYLFLVGVPPFLFAAANADALVTAWIGRPDAVAATTVRLLAIGYGANALSNALASVCQGLGKAALQAEQSVLQLVVNTLASLALLERLGPFGTLWGTSLALTAGALWFAFRFHPYLGLSTRTLLRQTAAAPLLLSAVAAFAGRLASGPLPADDRAHALALLIPGAAVFASVLAAGALGFRLVGAPELARVREALRPVPEVGA